MASFNGLVQAAMDTIDSSFDFMLQGRVEDSVISNRAILIRQEYTKTRQFPSWSLYDALIPLNRDIPCSCGGITTEGAFPKIIQFKEQAPFSFVGSDGFNAISYILPEEIEFYKYNPISKNLPRYTYKDKRTYFYGIGNLEKMLHRAPWADPRELKKYNCEDEYCFNDEDDDFLEEHLRPVILDMVLKEIGRKETDDHEVQSNGL